MSLTTDLIKLGLAQCYAETIDSHYGNQIGFVTDLERIAACIAFGGTPTADPFTAEPWVSIRNRIEIAVAISGVTIEEAFQRGLDDIEDEDLRFAVKEAVVLNASLLLNTQPYGKMGRAAPPSQTQRIKSIYLESPDPDLVNGLRSVLRSKALDEERKADLAALVVNWLSQHGRFIKTPQQDLFFLYRDTQKLYELGTERWRAWLYGLTSFSPASTNYITVDAACKTAIMHHGDRTEVVRMAHYDTDTQTLRVSRFDGTVYVLDGDTIEEEVNGDGPVLFDDFQIWEPYTPDFSGSVYSSGSCLEWLTRSVPNWDDKKDVQAQALHAWILSTFFSELCPPKPLLVMLGEKGSGKSMTLRVTLRLLFGQWAQISGVPDKPDGFVAAASHYHIYVLDNLDSMTAWLRDKLARITSGGIDEYRKLYTSNELGTVSYRCWLAITARTPDTLRRDDLTDRLLFGKVARLPANQRKSERAFLEEAQSIRNAWWGDVLTMLNRIIAELREGDTPKVSPLRLADWEILGRVISRANNKEAEWTKVVRSLLRTQAEFLAENDVVVEAVVAWIDSSALNIGREVSARDLYNEARDALWPSSSPDRDWPKSVNWFGRRISNVKEYLVLNYGMKSWYEKSGTRYQFMGTPGVI